MVVIILRSWILFDVTTKTFKLAPENYQISLQMSAFQHAHSLVTGMFFFFKENVKKKEKKATADVFSG